MRPNDHLPDAALTGLQLAKRYGKPYVKITIDERHIDVLPKHGRVEVDGIADDAVMAAARNLLRIMLDGEE